MKKSTKQENFWPRFRKGLKEGLGIGKVPHTKKDSLEEDLSLRLTKDLMFQEGQEGLKGSTSLKKSLDIHH